MTTAHTPQENDMTTTRDLSDYRAALYAGYAAYSAGQDREAPAAMTDPAMIDNWLDGWEEARSDAAQYAAGGFQSHD